MMSIAFFLTDLRSIHCLFILEKCAIKLEKSPEFKVGQYTNIDFKPSKIWYSSTIATYLVFNACIIFWFVQFISEFCSRSCCMYCLSGSFSLILICLFILMFIFMFMWGCSIKYYICEHKDKILIV